MHKTSADSCHVITKVCFYRLLQQYMVYGTSSFGIAHTVNFKMCGVSFGKINAVENA